MISLGIDLGTSAVRAAVHLAGGGQLARFSDGSCSLPAAVTWSHESLRLGSAALARASRLPQLTVLSVKRLLGRLTDEPLVEHLRSQMAVPLVADDRGRVALAFSQQRVSPESLAAALLTEAIHAVELACDRRPTTAVLCTPAWFSAESCAALENAGALAGLDSVQLISEAAAIALSLSSAALRPRVTAIVQVGAGGCSASMVELGPGAVRLLASAGSPFAGGDDVDSALVRAVLRDIEERVGSIPPDRCFVELLRRRCEAAKRTLPSATDPSSPTPLLKVHTGTDEPGVLVDQRLVHAVMHQPLMTLRALCQEALRAASLEPAEVPRLILAGGMTRLAVVRDEITAAFAGARACEVVPEGAVALGAARHAASLTGRADFVAVIDKLVATTASAPVPSAPPPSVRTIPPSSRKPASTPASGSLANPAPHSLRWLQEPAAQDIEALSARGAEDARPLLDGLASWATTRALAHEPGAALDLLESIERSFAARHSDASARVLRKRMEGALFTREWLEAALDQVASVPKPDSRSVAALLAALAAQPRDGLFEMVLSRLGQVDSPLVRSVLLGYLERFVHNHEADVTEILRSASADQALNLLATLRQAGTEQARDAAAAALTSEHGVVRLQAITLLAEDCPVLPREVLQALVDDPEPDVRTAILQVIRTQRIAAAGPAAAKRIRSSSFDRLDASERQLLLDTAAALSRRRAEELAIFLLDRAEVFTSEASERSREIAVRFLATCESTDALDALERAASRRWRSSSTIRETATRAAASIHTRRASRLPPPRT